MTIPRLSINVRLFLVSRTLKRRKVIEWDFRYHKFSPRFCVYKWASSLFPCIVFKFHMVERWKVRIAKLTLTSPIEDVQPEAHSLVLETKDCFVSLVTHLKSKNCKHWCLLYTQGNANPLTFKPIKMKRCVEKKNSQVTFDNLFAYFSKCLFGFVKVKFNVTN